MAEEGAKKAAKKGGAKKASSAKKAAAGPAKKALGAKKAAPTKAAPAKKAATSSPRAGDQPGHEAVAERAYYIYEQDQGGDAVEHWLQAERELSDES